MLLAASRSWVELSDENCDLCKENKNNERQKIIAAGATYVDKMQCVGLTQRKMLPLFIFISKLATYSSKNLAIR